jgi:hypothetical protein
MSEEGFSGGMESTKALSTIARIQAHTGDYAGALKSADMIREDNSVYETEKSDVVQMIAAQQAKSGDVKGVLAWAEKRSAARSKLVALQGMAEGIIARKKPAD